jgi:hypothetical protein
MKNAITAVKTPTVVWLTDVQLHTSSNMLKQKNNYWLFGAYSVLRNLYRYVIVSHGQLIADITIDIWNEFHGSSSQIQSEKVVVRLVFVEYTKPC